MDGGSTMDLGDDMRMEARHRGGGRSLVAVPIAVAVAVVGKERAWSSWQATE